MPNRPTGPAEGEALRRLIEKWRASMVLLRHHIGVLESTQNDPLADLFGERLHTIEHMTDELEATLAPLSGPVDASGEPEPIRRWIRGLAADITLHVRRGVWHATEVEQAITDFATRSTAAAAVPSSPAQELSREDLIRGQQTLTRALEAAESELAALKALPPSSPVADSPKVTDAMAKSAAQFKKLFVPVTYEPCDGDTLAVRMCKKIYNLTALAKFHGTPIGPSELRIINSAAFAGLEGDDEIEASAPSPSAGAAKE